MQTSNKNRLKEYAYRIYKGPTSKVRAANVNEAVEIAAQIHVVPRYHVSLLTFG